MSTGEREPVVVRDVLFAAWPASLEDGAVVGVLALDGEARREVRL